MNALTLRSALLVSALVMAAPALAGVNATANRDPINPANDILSQSAINSGDFALADIVSSIGTAYAAANIGAGRVAAQSAVSLATANPYASGVFTARAQAFNVDYFRAGDDLCSAIICSTAASLGVATIEMDFTIRAAGTVAASGLDQEYNSASSSIAFGWKVYSGVNVALGGGVKQATSRDGITGDISSQGGTLTIRPGADIGLELSAQLASTASLASFANSGLTSSAISTNADFSHTLEWKGVTGFRAFDAGGNRIQLAPGTRFTLLDAAGHDFWASAASFGAAAVPEPANWALLLTGFGLVGGTLRRRAPRPALN